VDFLAIPPAVEARGEVRAPPSKSATNRALILAALSETPVEVIRPLDAEDTRALIRCLSALGARIRPTSEGLAVHGPLRTAGDAEILLDAGESGSAARFLTGLAAALPGRFLLTGSPRLRERPIAELVSALRSNGADVVFRSEEGHLPLAIRGGALRGGTISVNASRSSQFVSALAIAAVAVEGGMEIRADGPVASAPYVQMTLESLAAFGHSVSGGKLVRVTRGAASPTRYETPGDYSSSLALLAAAAIAGGEVVVRGLTWPSRDADAAALDVFEAMGVEIEGNAGRVAARAIRGTLVATELVATDFPDAVPVLAAMALFARGTTRIEGIGHLRGKESDRVAALGALLAAAGGSAEAGADSLRIAGAESAGVRGRLPTASDHRIVMAASLIAAGGSGGLVESPGHVAKSYPGFFADLQRILVNR
jgi:3-phosphoshikimate 1-carboxyvinyltransferase